MRKKKEATENHAEGAIQIGGVGVAMLGGGNLNIHPHLSQHLAASQLPATSTTSTHHATVSHQMLPAGSGLHPTASARLQQLSALYVELKHAEELLRATLQFLPKLRNSGEYLTDSLATRISAIKAEIAALAKPPQGKPWPDSKPSTAKR